MKVISILNPKGGVGKTTVAIHLARALQQRGNAVVLFDTDVQGSALAWSSIGALRPSLRVEKADTDALQKRIQNLFPIPDYVVIDGAAKLEPKRIAAAVKVSDLVVIPVQPSALDLWGCAELIQAIITLKEMLDKPQGYFLVNRQVIGTALSRDIQEALEAEGLPVLAARLTNRVAYTESISAGQTVLDIEPDSKAAQELNAVTNEITGLING